jgi:FkbM family methyltransferase
MLIPFSTITNKYNLDNTKNILHIGAHECEEKNSYNSEGFKDEQIFWIDGNENLVKKIKSLNKDIIIYDALISDKDYDEVEFIITNNMQSSSILELDEHLKEHPWVYEINRYKKHTVTIDTLLKNNNIDFKNFEFVNIDIQGAELLALKGMKIMLPFLKYLYLEVNIKHLYKNCALINEIDTFLKDYNFIRCETVITDYGWGDAFYIKSNL